MTENNIEIKTLEGLDTSDIEKIQKEIRNDYQYQEELTKELDVLSGDFDQGIVNKIVLWKVNRYANLSDEIIKFLNQISKDDEELNEDVTRNLLRLLLPIRGMRLPMSSAILRFKNPKIYQILDHRIYRVIAGKDLFFPEEIDGQVDLYFDYLKELKKVCSEWAIDYTLADRVLYKVDKDLLNKNMSFRPRRGQT